MPVDWPSALLGAIIAILGAGASALFGHLIRIRPLRAKIQVHKATFKSNPTGRHRDGPPDGEIEFKLHNASHNMAAPCVMTVEIVTFDGAERIPWAYNPVRRQLNLGMPPGAAGAIYRGLDPDQEDFLPNFPVAPGEKVPTLLNTSSNSFVMNRPFGFLRIRVQSGAGRFGHLLKIRPAKEEVIRIPWWDLYHRTIARLFSIRRVPNHWDNNPAS